MTKLEIEKLKKIKPIRPKKIGTKRMANPQKNRGSIIKPPKFPEIENIIKRYESNGYSKTKA